MNTPGVQLAYANRLFLRMVHETGSIGRVATKPTQAMEDGIIAGLHSWLLRVRSSRSDEHTLLILMRNTRNALIESLPCCPLIQGRHGKLGGRIEQHISDTNYGLLLWDLIEKRDCIVLATDLDGDRLTDLLADVSDALRAYGGMVRNMSALTRT